MNVKVVGVHSDFIPWIWTGRSAGSSGATRSPRAMKRELFFLYLCDNQTASTNVNVQCLRKKK